MPDESDVPLGLSFAVPINIAMKVAEQLRAHGRVIRGRLGVRMQEVTPDLVRSFGLESAAGALVSAVEKASSAEKAGILPGDIILALNDRKVDRIADLNKLLAALPRRGTVALLVQRAGSLVYLAVRLD